MSGTSSTDYWSSEFEPGTSSSWRFQGRSGLQRLSGPALIGCADPDRFEATLTRVQLDHVALELLDASAHRWTREVEQIAAYPTPLLTFLQVQEGTLTVVLAGVSFTVSSGQAIVVDSRDLFVYVAEGPVRILRSVVGLEHVPARLRARGATIPGPLPLSRLVDSFVAFASSILATTASGHRAGGEHLVRAVADLQNAVLAEAQQVTTDPNGPAGTRWRMEEYIDTHYADPCLDQHGVARALGISLHRARSVFNDGEHTIPRFIRDRRVTAAALELRTAPGAVRLNDLARRCGFGSTDSFTRAFQERFASTPAEYREQGHHHLG